MLAALSGTPVLNRESELHTQLRLSGHPVGLMPLKDFIDTFGGSSEFRKDLRHQIGDWMLRRRKDVLTHLKGKQRQLVDLDLTDDDRAFYESIVASEQPALIKIGALRRALERFKLQLLIELITELDVEDKVIVFCEYKQSVAILKEACRSLGSKCVTLIGSDSPAKRQKAIDNFQNDVETRIFIGTTRAAGTGINLTAANYVFFASLPWTPAYQEQAEDRAYRNGQLKLVVVKIPLVKNTIDQQLWAMLQAKRSLASELVESDEENRARNALADAFF